MVQGRQRSESGKSKDCHDVRSYLMYIIDGEEDGELRICYRLLDETMCIWSVVLYAACRQNMQ